MHNPYDLWTRHILAAPDHGLRERRAGRSAGGSRDAGGISLRLVYSSTATLLARFGSSRRIDGPM
jgi:hypothetical protein